MGIYRITSLITPAPSYDLVSLAFVKSRLGLPDSDTTHDDMLTAMISEVSAASSRYCNRASATADEASFPIEAITDLFFPERDAYPYQVPGGVQPLQLSHWPVASIQRKTIGADVASGSTAIAIADTSKLKIGLAVGGCVNGPLSAMPPAGGPQTIQPGTVIANLDAVSVTLSLPTVQNIAAGTAITFGLSIVQTDPPGNDQVLVDNVDFVIDAPRGQLLRLDRFTAYPTIWPPIRLLVQYEGGYSPIPDDVATAASRWVTQLFADKDRNPNLRSRTQPGLGEEVFWVGGPPSSGGVPMEIAATLDRYRVAVTA